MTTHTDPIPRHPADDVLGRIEATLDHTTSDDRIGDGMRWVPPRRPLIASAVGAALSTTALCGLLVLAETAAVARAVRAHLPWPR